LKPRRKWTQALALLQGLLLLATSVPTFAPQVVRYQNWKMYYTMSQPGAEGWILPLVPFHFTLVDDIRRDPFEQAVGLHQKTALSIFEARWILPALPSCTTGTSCQSASSSGSIGSRR
jgi:hypothetical protein